MTALRKTLLFVLVICTLGYGSAWAYDGHAVAMGDDEHAVVYMVSTGAAHHAVSDQHSEQSPEKTPAASIDCDHCAHISAHLLAIFFHNSYLCGVNQSSELLELSESSVSFIVSPDLRPPRV